MRSIFNFLILFHSLLLISSLIRNEGPLLYPEPPEGWNEGDCQSKEIQSPIDIPPLKDNSTIKDDGSHAKIQSLLYSNINSGKVDFDGGHKWTTGELNIGHIEIILNQTLYKYKLHSFHFHLNSEHRIESKQYPMELHLVHKNENNNDTLNENLVIAILFDYKSDKENKFLKDIKLSEREEINDASIFDLINKDDTFYYYKGSLTTVLCTENVNWIVFKEIRSMSYEQYYKFKNWVENSNKDFYGNGYGNARGPKGLNGRKIYLENYKDDSPSNGNSFLAFSQTSTFLVYLLLILF